MPGFFEINFSKYSEKENFHWTVYPECTWGIYFDGHYSDMYIAKKHLCLK